MKDRVRGTKIEKKKTARGTKKEEKIEVENKDGGK